MSWRRMLALAALSQGESGTLRIGTYQSVGARILPQILQRYRASWPEVDPTLLKDDSITLPVQINGKKRAEVTVAADADTVSVEAVVRANEAVQRALEGRSIRKIIVVPGRIVNVVV